MTALARIRTYGSMVSFSHTVFAMPFAASAVVLSLAVPHAALEWRRVLAMLGCMVCARTSAMAFNRWADRRIDAENPRTRLRHVPAGQVQAWEALALALGCGAAFVACAATLGFWCGALAPVVLAVLLGYSYAKRFTWAAHAWLGVALALAPGGAWLGMGARPEVGIVLLMVAVVTWLLGFDTLYSLQDEVFDRGAGLHSIPARFRDAGRAGDQRVRTRRDGAGVDRVRAGVAPRFVLRRSGGGDRGAARLRALAGAPARAIRD